MYNNEEKRNDSSRRRFVADNRQNQNNNRYSSFSDRNNNDANEAKSHRPRFNRSVNNNRPLNRVKIEDEERAYSGERNFNRNNKVQRPKSANPNMKYSNRKQFEYNNREVDMNKPVRLNKYLANAGICSRREADDFIQAGVITVNGQVVTELGTKIMPTDKVMFHDQLVRTERKVYVLLNKPKNTITTTDDPEERNTVMNLVRNVCSERIYPVGRLDRNTTGVLLLTNDGDLAAKLTHPKYNKKKTYQAKLDKPLTDEDYQKVMDGIELDGEKIIPDDLQFIDEADHANIGLTIHSGQNRVVRRIFERIGYKVVKLDRTVFAGLTKKNLSRGKYRFLTPKEISMLKMGAFE
ncbi:MAG: rRNA pseudouridine synthase [Paludibacteraceae bacterium]|nr:rRNA pseudouridine synthase [Paludibacteraceae bacterium]